MDEIETLRDQLAVAMGWSKNEADEWCHEDHEARRAHPIPASLDFVAGAMPEGWRWAHIVVQGVNPLRWSAMSTGPVTHSCGVGPTELHARLACSVQAWKAHNATKGVADGR